MIRKSITLLLAAISMAACTDKQTFTIEGAIEGAADSTLYLYHQSLAGPVLLDSAKLGSDGGFTFKSDAPDAPDFYVLCIADQIVNISIDSTETVTVKGQWPGMASRYTVEGSQSCENIRQLALKQQALQRQVMELESGRPMSREEQFDSLQHMIERYKDDVRMNYIFKYPERPEAYFALFQTLGQWNIFERNNPQDVRAFGAVATCWDTYYPHALRTEHLHNTALKGINERRAQDARSQSTLDSDKIITSGLIELRLPDASGKTRTLTELNGKVVILDFHIFGQKESAARILELRELYNKYHDQGLEIYQVGLDADEHFWKQQTANLPWVCVYDPAGESLPSYNVQALPEFFLIDRNSQLQKRSTQMTDVDEEIRKELRR